MKSLYNNNYTKQCLSWEFLSLNTSIVLQAVKVEGAFVAGRSLISYLKNLYVDQNAKTAVSIKIKSYMLIACAYNKYNYVC